MTEVIDRERLLTICDGDTEEMRELLRLVAESARDILVRLSTAFDRSDLLEAKNAAHELRGAASTAGALELANLAERLDDGLRVAESTAPVRPCIDDLRAALDRLVAAAALL